QRLDALRGENLLRELRRIDSPQLPHIQIDGKPFLNFSSNDYLGLANDPLLKNAAIEAVKKFGAGSGASRLICGSLAPHHELEETLADFKKTVAALVFATGYAAAVGTICALAGKDDIIVLDKLVHASIIDASRLCGAQRRIFAHNDLNELEDILKWANEKIQSPKSKGQSASQPHILIVTESVFSMDGDCAPLTEIVALKEKYGAWLMVDEAHATGIHGAHGRGLSESCGVSQEIEVQMGTLGKALGASGGYICGSRSLIDYLVNRARSFIFSTAPVPAAAAAATAAIRFSQTNDGEQRRQLLWQRVNQFNSKCKTHNAKLSAIIPLMIGDENKAVQTATDLRSQGFLIPAIRFPTVARGAARLRLTLTARHTMEEVEKLCDALDNLKIAMRNS
ncbi:MAG: 8-amino-7-oxononanoate synthase, partial [Verrucomicrobiota bacterium]